LGSVLLGSDPNKWLFLFDNRSKLGCFFLLGPAFWGQKVGFKGFAWVKCLGVIVKIALKAQPALVQH